jgi:transposase
MKSHANARLSPIGRQLLVDRIERDHWPVLRAADAAGVTPRTASKWLARWRAEGAAGLLDRSSAPKTVANKTDAKTVEVIVALRRIRFSGPEIAELLDRPLSTVSAVLKREGLGKLGRLGLKPAQRYERERPGELIHIDIKKLGRIQRGAGKRMRDNPNRPYYTPRRTDAEGRRRKTVGWEYVHVCVDDATRLAYVEVLNDEKGQTVAGFLRRAVAHYASYGITVERVMTDNGPGYRSACTRSPAASPASATSAPAPTDPARTAKQNASSARCSAAGHTARSGHQRRTHPRTHRLARPLQSPTTTRQPQQTAAPHPPRATEEQPSWVLQLGHPDLGATMRARHRLRDRRRDPTRAPRTSRSAALV